MAKYKIIACLLVLMSLTTRAELIKNGSFGSCDFSDWQTSTDGGVGSSNDFSIINDSNQCSAQLQVDHMSPAGDPFGAFLNDAFFGNTLSQSLDFTGTAGSTWLLSIDYAISTQGDSNDPFFVPDNFFFGLSDKAGAYKNADGSEGLLLSTQNIISAGNNNFEVELSSLFTNTSDWMLELQLNVGADDTGFPDAFGSSLLFKSVSLVEQLANVPQLSSPNLFILLLVLSMGLLIRRSKGAKN